MKLINFPTDSSVQIFSFSSLKLAEARAVALAGASFVVSGLDAASLTVLTGPQLVTIYNAANPDHQVKRLGGSKRKVSERVLPLIDALAIPGETSSTSSEDKETTMATRKKSSSTATAEAEPKRRGRTPDFAGKKLHKTEKGNTARRNEASRRTATWNVISNGMKYETALEKGAHKDDIVILARTGHIEAKD